MKSITAHAPLNQRQMLSLSNPLKADPFVKRMLRNKRDNFLPAETVQMRQRKSPAARVMNLKAMV